MTHENRVHLSRAARPAYQAREAFSKTVGGIAADSGVDDRLKELVQIHASQLNGCAYCVRIHVDRAAKAGVLARIMPSLQDAALWRNYEREYVKVKNESDEAFMEVFSKEFRKAYERQLREGFGDR